MIHYEKNQLEFKINRNISWIILTILIVKKKIINKIYLKEIKIIINHNLVNFIKIKQQVKILLHSHN